LNNRIYVERRFENLNCTNLSKLMLESRKKLMNENNKSFYPLDMFEIIHHPDHGCRNLKGLNLGNPTAHSNMLFDGLLK
jgi:hypothetical protein